MCVHARCFANATRQLPNWANYTAVKVQFEWCNEEWYKKGGFRPYLAFVKQSPHYINVFVTQGEITCRRSLHRHGDCSTFTPVGTLYTMIASAFSWQKFYMLSEGGDWQHKRRALLSFVDVVFTTPLCMIGSVFCIAIVHAGCWQENAINNAFCFHLLEIVTDKLSGVSSILFSLQVDRILQWNLLCPKHFSLNTAFQCLVTYPFISFNQLSLYLLAKERTLSLENKAGIADSGIRKPFRTAFKLFSLAYLLHFLPYVPILLLECAHRITSSVAAFVAHMLCFGLLQAAFCVELVTLFIVQLRYTIRIRKALVKFAKGVKGVMTEELARRAAEMKKNKRLLIGTVGLNLCCITVVICYMLLSSAEKVSRALSDVMALYTGKPSTASKLFNGVFMSLYNVPLAMELSVHFFSDVNSTCGVIFHIIYTNIGNDLFKKVVVYKFVKLAKCLKTAVWKFSSAVKNFMADWKIVSHEPKL